MEGSICDGHTRSKNTIDFTDKYGSILYDRDFIEDSRKNRKAVEIDLVKEEAATEQMQVADLNMMAWIQNSTTLCSATVLALGGHFLPGTIIYHLLALPAGHPSLH